MIKRSLDWDQVKNTVKNIDWKKITPGLIGAGFGGTIGAGPAADLIWKDPSWKQRSVSAILLAAISGIGTQAAAQSINNSQKSATDKVAQGANAFVQGLTDQQKPQSQTGAARFAGAFTRGLVPGLYDESTPSAVSRSLAALMSGVSSLKSGQASSLNKTELLSRKQKAGILSNNTASSAIEKLPGGISNFLWGGIQSYTRGKDLDLKKDPKNGGMVKAYRPGAVPALLATLFPGGTGAVYGQNVGSTLAHAFKLGQWGTRGTRLGATVAGALAELGARRAAGNKHPWDSSIIRQVLDNTLRK